MDGSLFKDIFYRCSPTIVCYRFDHSRKNRFRRFLCTGLLLRTVSADLFPTVLSTDPVPHKHRLYGSRCTDPLLRITYTDILTTVVSTDPIPHQASLNPIPFSADRFRRSLSTARFLPIQSLTTIVSTDCFVAISCGSCLPILLKRSWLLPLPPLTSTVSILPFTCKGIGLSFFPYGCFLRIRSLTCIAYDTGSFARIFFPTVVFYRSNPSLF